MHTDAEPGEAALPLDRGRNPRLVRQVDLLLGVAQDELVGLQVEAFLRAADGVRPSF